MSPTPDDLLIDTTLTVQKAQRDATRVVFIVSIDIKDGWYDIVRGFSSREAAETYMAWQNNRTGDACYVTEVPIEDGLTPEDRPTPPRNKFLHDHETWMEEDSHRHVHWDDEADNWRRCEARHQ